MPVSVFIQTLNEEDNLPRCLKSLAWSDDIVVLDSYSTDRTEEIARSAGAGFYQRKYDGRANNQNWAVENIDFKYPWVYQSDADETVSEELANEIAAVTADTSREEVVYWVRFKNMLHGRWIKRSGMYPIWVPRLWKPDKIRWERGANPRAIIDGTAGHLKEHFVHHTLSKGFEQWFAKQNKTSTYEAQETIKELKYGRIDWSGLISRDPVKRRHALKRLSFRMPCRPLLMFMYIYLLRRGFLDGRPGFTYCMLQTIEEYQICCKVREFYRREKEFPGTVDRSS
jgi:glycosyltransferase involved in cell wall biosynthesis